MIIRAVLRTLLLTSATLAGACSSSPDVLTGPTSVRPEASGASPGVPAADGTCVAADAQWAVGQPASEELLEKARVAAKATVARFLRPNQPITLEYLGTRLNLGLDDNGIVRVASCG